MEFDLENPLTSFEEHQSDTIPTLFANESDHMPSLAFKADDFPFSVRQQAISLLLQAQFTCNFDSFICYLAVNYMDRFISKQEMPQGKPWIPRLLVISCLSLAAKMKNADLSLSNLQRERESELQRIIFKVHYEIKLLEYKPSIIAASAILCASQDLFPLQYSCFRTAISSCEYLNKEELLKCLGVMQVMVMERRDLVFNAVSSSTTKTPIGVLDRHCTNTESEDTASDTLMAESDNIKRRKLNGFCSDRAVQLSQMQQC
ncbi:hypothetical protein F0562_014189 [Nyssa sinensis]|uniref:Cyclin-like domain-containing protein n=1 Tax=Nyssa sinensis TaxID=561372 RepID=A0A5J4ZS60_9ASTE|nr:hypothetical protein F0562_014189 [Nyssa sinensis]